MRGSVRDRMPGPTPLSVGQPSRRAASGRRSAASLSGVGQRCRCQSARLSVGVVENRGPLRGGPDETHEEPSETAQDEVRKCIEHFEKHQKRMRYAWYRKHSMLIGSGVHAWVIQARCRLPGMRWSVEGANAMLRLRCAWASGRFDEEFTSPAELAPATDQNLKVVA